LWSIVVWSAAGRVELKQPDKHELAKDFYKRIPAAEIRELGLRISGLGSFLQQP
jgi:hypothetical protein